MFRVLGSARQLCEGVTRRDLLRVGGLGLAGLGLDDILRLQDASAATKDRQPGSFGRAKAVILLHLYGSPSQLEWADMKPDAPVEIRGELGGVSSSLPGLDVCELLPNLGKVMDRTTVIRSMTHPYPIHGVANAWTGVPAIDVAMELSPRDSRHWPYFASVVEYVDEQLGRNAGRRPDVPQNMALPFPFSSQRTGEVFRAGPYAAFLGGKYNPIWTEWKGTATKKAQKTLRNEIWDDYEPYVGTSVDSHFAVPSATGLQPEITLDRLDRRRSLLEQFETTRADFEKSQRSQQMNRYREMAMSLVSSNKLRDALDVRKEANSTRELYGHTLFGQSCLAARRLVDAGSRVVSVFWDEYGFAGSGWDTHWEHYPRMKHELCPGFDRAWYGLITDLDQRGMLDDVLVVCGSEHGRTPKIKTGRGGGRDHWSRAYTSMIAGAGIKRGHIVGATDDIGGDVADYPVGPKDLMATMYHLLGINHHMTIPDREGRLFPLVEGNLIEDALA